MSSHSIALLVVALCAASCVRPYATVAHEVRGIEDARRTEALDAALRARSLTRVDAAVVTATLPRDVEGCEPSSAPTPMKLAAPRPVTVDACKLRELSFGQGKVLVAKSDDEQQVTLVRAGDLDMHGTVEGSLERYAIAKNVEGRLIVLHPRRRVAERRSAHVEGTCNRMPSPGQWAGATLLLFVLDGAVTSVDTIDVPYDGIQIDVKCDHTVQ